MVNFNSSSLCGCEIQVLSKLEIISAQELKYNFLFFLKNHCMCCKCPILMKTRVLAHVFDHCTYLGEPSVIIFVAEEFKYKTLCFYFVVF